MRSRRRTTGALLTACLVVGWTPAAGAPATPLAATQPILVAPDGLWELPAEGWPAPAAIDARSWILVDVGTGQILGSREAEDRRPPASTTKLLTALAVTRRVPGSSVALVSELAASQAGASSGLGAGDQVSVDDLLALLLLRSGNDAAVVLAEHTAGSVEAFSDLMSQEARLLGLEDFVVREPHGLEDRNRLSARHLSVIGRAVLADDRLRPLVGAGSWTLSTGRVVVNRNELLGEVEGATGLKTGMTTAAGWSLVASARRGPRHLVAVVLGGTSHEARFADAARLLEFGFTAFDQPPPVPDLVLRGEGAWVRFRAEPPRGVLPFEATVALEPRLPVELRSPAIRWAWTSTGGSVGHWLQPTDFGEGSTALRLSPVGSIPTDPGAEGTAALGAWLSGRIQAGLRAATVADAWGD